MASCSRIGIAIASIDCERKFPPSLRLPIVTAVILDPVTLALTESEPK